MASSDGIFGGLGDAVAGFFLGVIDRLKARRRAQAEADLKAGSEIIAQADAEAREMEAARRELDATLSATPATPAAPPPVPAEPHRG